MGLPALLTLMGASGGLQPNLFTSVLLKDSDPAGARCLDGTPPRIWVHKSLSSNPENRTKWQWHFQGGGWCESEEACTQRAFDPKKCMIGSSSEACFNNHYGHTKNLTSVMDIMELPSVNGARWGGGLLNNSAATNPLAHDWNKVIMFYCDGGSYSGNNATPVPVTYEGKATKIYYRGSRNLDLGLATLIKDWGMGDATDVLISGDSAGGLASYWHADRFAKALPKAFVATVPDSGFFIGDASKPAWPAALEWIVSAMNSTAGLDASCVAAAQASGKSPGKVCTLPEDVSPYVEVPLFTMNSKYDSAMIGISSTEKDAEGINGLATRFVAKLNTAVLGPNQTKNGAFITACHEHCGQWAQGQKDGQYSDFNATVDGTTAPFAVQRWFAANKVGAQKSAREFVNIATAKYPCANCCDGGDGP